METNEQSRNIIAALLHLANKGTYQVDLDVEIGSNHANLS